MQHIIFVYYVGSLASGFAGILLGLLYYLKSKRDIVKRYLGLMLLFTVYLLLLNVHYYQRTILFFDSELVRALAELIFALAIGGLFYLAPKALYLFLGKSFSARASAISLFLACLPFSASALKIASGIELGGTILPRVLIYGIALFALASLAKEYKHLVAPKKRMARLIFAFIAGFLLVQTLDDIVSLLYPFHYPLTAMPLYYFLCNAASALFVFKHFREKPETRDTERIGDAFFEKYGITQREREVIALILEGCANKQIAARLGLSFSTVKNHIYNIFQKTGTRSKIELYRLVSGAEGVAKGL